MVGQDDVAVKTVKTAKKEATLLQRPDKRWSKREEAIMRFSHKAAIHPDDETTLVVDGHHSKEEMARALSLDFRNLGKLGSNDFDCVATEVDVEVKD